MRVTIVITTSWQNVCAVSVCICPLSLRFPSRCFPLVLLSLCKCLVMFCPRSRKGVPKLFTPNCQTRFVLEFVLNAGSCYSNSSVRPRGRWVVSAYARGQGLKVLQVFKRPFLCWSYTCWCNAPAGFLQPRGAAGRLDPTENGIMACHRCAVRVSNSVVESCSRIMRNGPVAA